VPEASDWDSLFDELYLRTYASLQPEADAEDEALAVVRLADVEAGADVLDCPCGYGRHSIPLARAGYRVAGADRSEALLTEARRRSGAAHWPRFVHADYRELPYDAASFDCVLNLFSSLGYWGEEGDRQALAEFRRVLRSGGRLVVETMHRDRLTRIFRAESWQELPDGSLLLERRAFDPVTGIAEIVHMLVEVDGTRTPATYRWRAYTATELVRLVREAGFEELAYYGDYGGAPFTVDTRLVVVAR
jgi:ubiquinone/menaquinone biosynthesis C-methylase UbiE